MIRKLYNLIPKIIQEEIKLIYYNYKIKDYSFSIKNDVYNTQHIKGWSLFTNSPLYFIVKDVERYEKYYKVNKDDIVIDAGANEGILSLIYSRKVLKNGKVYAFEPDSKNLTAFKNNLKINQENENIILMHKGLWNISDSIIFYEAGTVGSSLFYESEGSKKVSIPVTSIDDFIIENNITKLDFIKMDIEGAEIEAIHGAINTLKNLKPNFAIASYHIIDNEFTYKKVEEFFAKINYPFKTIFYDDGEIITYAGHELK